MADKTWIATDLQLGKLAIGPHNSTLHIERRYTFLDANGDVMPEIKGGRFVADIEWSSLPTNIQDALTAINAWTKTQALIQEGMN